MSEPTPSPPPEPPPLLQTRELTRIFQLTSRTAQFQARGQLVAVDSVSLRIPRGGAVGLVGESGSGKTTLGRCLLRLMQPTSGEILYWDSSGVCHRIDQLDPPELQRFRRKLQIVFQDPYQSLNPRRPIFEVVGEGLLIHQKPRRKELVERAAEALRQVGLEPEMVHRFPHEFSGGQRQRLALARALILRPEFIVCDEITSALDTRTQAQILELLHQLQAEFGLSLLFISHDLHVVASVSQHVLVMHQGRIVEEGPPVAIFSNPTQPYTRTLVEALPHPDPRRRTFRARAERNRKSETGGTV